MTKPRVGLDNPVLAGRVRTDYRRSSYQSRPVQPIRSRIINDIQIVKVKKPPKPQQSSQAHAVVHPVVVRAPLQSHLSSATQAKQHVPSSHSIPVGKKWVRKRPGKFTANSVLSVIAIALIGGGLLIGWYSLRTNRDVATQAQQLAQKNEDNTEESPVPSETKPATREYRVAPDLPRYIDIPKLGTHARVLRLGVTSTNQLKAPSNIFDAGWYDGSAKPGEAGATVIDGHLSGPTQNGVFYGLKTLKPGDQIKVERGDGKILTYRVVSLKTYAADQVDMAAVLTPVIAGKSGLNLITCAGDLDASRTHFDERTVVFATQI